jgi:hypothetical protein
MILESAVGNVLRRIFTTDFTDFYGLHGEDYDLNSDCSFHPMGEMNNLYNPPEEQGYETPRRKGSQVKKEALHRHSDILGELGVLAFPFS